MSSRPTARRTNYSWRYDLNDVSELSPGVYFVQEAQAQARAQAVRKVLVLHQTAGLPDRPTKRGTPPRLTAGPGPARIAGIE